MIRGFLVVFTVDLGVVFRMGVVLVYWCWGGGLYGEGLGGSCRVRGIGFGILENFCG